MVMISADARRIQVDLYKVLVGSYLIGKMPIGQAMERAAHEATQAAVFFDQRFPTAPTITLPKQPSAATAAPAPSKPAGEVNGVLNGQVLTGWAPGVAPEVTNGGTKTG